MSAQIEFKLATTTNQQVKGKSGVWLILHITIILLEVPNLQIRETLKIMHN
jgi:hypothetical protein